MSKIIHFSDLHFNRENKNKALASLIAIRDRVRIGDIIAVVDSADTFDMSVQNTEASGIPALKDVILEILEHTPIITVYGTETHDIPGCLEIFTSLKANYPFIVLRPGYMHKVGSMAFSGYPEPNKKWIQAATEGLSLNELKGSLNDAMSELMRAVGAAWAEHDGPKVFIYHGEVRGAKYQNGREKAEASKVAVTVDDLRSTMADYIALGHIHMFQKIPGVEAYYPGPGYPRWGEYEQTGFIVWDSETRQIERIPYPHPVKKKIDVKLPDLYPDGVSGYDVWLNYVGTRDQLATLDLVEIREEMKRRGALTVRVSKELLRSDTARAKEIIQYKSLPHKLKVYGEASDVEITDSMIEKSSIIEQAFDHGFDNFKPQHFRIDFVEIRGATGIWKGQKKEYAAIDFRNYETGLFGLFGDNGYGKSTFIRNCHPYPTTLKTGSLKRYFFLKDSFRRVYITDVYGEIEYKSEIFIDGETASGKVDAMLFMRPAGSEQWQPISNGRILSKPAKEDDYISVVNKIFGPEEIFVRSAFVMQPGVSGSDSLITSQPAEKKILFNELLGNSYLEKYADFAKNRVGVIEAEVAESRRKIQNLSESIQREKQAYETDIIQALKEKEEIQKSIDDSNVSYVKSLEVVNSEKDIENKYELLKTKNDDLESEIMKDSEVVNNLNIEYSDYSKNISEIFDLSIKKEKLDEYKKELSELKNKRSIIIENYNRLKSDHLDEMKKRQDEEKSIRDKINALINNKNSILEKIEKEYLTKFSSWKESVRVNADKRNKISEGISRIKSDVTIAESETIRISREIEQDESRDSVCSKCGKSLTEEEKIEIEKLVKIKKESLKDIYDQIENKKVEIQKLEDQKQCIIDDPEPEKDIDSEIEEIDITIKNLKDSISVDEEEEFPESADTRDIDSQIYLIENNISLIPSDIDEKLKKLQEIQSLADGIKLKINTISESLENKKLTKNKVEEELILIKPKYDSYIKNVEIMNLFKKELSLRENSLIRIDERISMLQKTNERISSEEIRLEEMKNKIDPMMRDLNEWTILHLACGKNGIQALELDALAPSVSDEANRILSNSYGDRFTIEIRTTKNTGSGKNAKEVEDFDIWIYDSEETNEALSWQTLSTNSGGEAVWLLKSLYDAFGIVRERNTGKKFLTVFQDEMDGALSHEKKVTFMRMVEAAHIEAERDKTILISHDLAIQEMIPQKVEITEITS